MSTSASVRWLGYGAGALGVTLAAFTIGPRLPSPWPLEWMEGASLHHALRLAAGLPLYAAPSAEFVPFLYPPVAYVPMALGTLLFGSSLWVGRLVSVLAFAGSLYCVGRIAARATGAAAVGCGAAGLYAIGFGYTGAFADLVRVDSVFMLLVLLGIERLTARAIAPGFAWLVLSCFAKQFGVLFLVAGWVVHRRHYRAVAWSAGALALGVGALELASGGYFLRYTLLPHGHGFDPVLVLTFFGIDVLLYLPVLALFVGLRLVRADGGLGAPWIAWLAAGLVASALGRAHAGGHDNVLTPAFAVLVIAGSIGWHELASRRALWSLAFAIQVLWLHQLPSVHRPDAEHARYFQSLTAALRRCAGGELTRAVALDHALLTGRPYVHTMALSDLFVSEDRSLYQDAERALLSHLAGPDAPPSLATSETFGTLREVLARHYAPCAEVPRLQLPTGYTVERTRVYRRNDVQIEGGLLWR